MSTPMTDDEIERFIAAEFVARLGCHSGGRTYVVPVAYAYAGGTLHCFSYEGLKLEMLRANPELCVEIDRVEHLGSWRSVIAQGRAAVLDGIAALKAAGLLATRLTTLIDDPRSRGRLEEALGGDRELHVVSIALHDKTGRVEGTIRP
ncbi:MAG: pyridoxamine 5'-phosphate oxidase family protein [Acidobacteria bacterium]|nr:pyridoxamine 5'-phosphate oxidase family protein [Acidobacteriota bacterium]